MLKGDDVFKLDMMLTEEIGFVRVKFYVAKLKTSQVRIIMIQRLS